MKTKHRRLFGQNNRNASHFFSLSASLAENLAIRVKFLVISFFLVVFTHTANANGEYPNHEHAIDSFVQKALAEQFPEVLASDIGYELNLPGEHLLGKACNQTLQFGWRGEFKPGSNTLNVVCEAPKWQIYVSATVKVFKEVVVASEPLSRSNTISISTIGLRRMDISQLRRGYFTELAALEGYLLQRTVKTGQVITPYLAKAPSLIKRGDWVTVISGKGALTVSTTGEALKDGRLGEQIPVKNLRTKQTFRAWVLRKGVVTTKKELI